MNFRKYRIPRSSYESLKNKLLSIAGNDFSYEGGIYRFLLHGTKVSLSPNRKIMSTLTVGYKGRNPPKHINDLIKGFDRVYYLN